MNTCLIFGAFGYFGFELARELLEEGVKVIHVNIGDEFEPQEYVTEKDFRVGRNANWKMIKEDLIPWREIDVVIIPVCDWIYFPEDEQRVVEQRLKTYLAGNRNGKEVFIKTCGKEMIVPELEKTARLIIAVPELYGGFQPPGSPFFKKLLKEEEPQPPQEALPVQVVAQTVRELVENEEGQYILKPGNEEKRSGAEKTDAKKEGWRSVYIDVTDDERELAKLKQFISRCKRETTPG